MTEHERLMERKIFNPVDPELVKIKLKAHNLCAEYNQSFENEIEKRESILKQMLREIGERVRIQGPIFFNYGVHTTIGNHFFANYNFVVQDDAPVVFGDDIQIGPNVTIVTPEHPLLGEEREHIMKDDQVYSYPCYARPITIGNKVWIAANVTICGGVKVGDGAVIAAGSVVIHDVPENTLVAGVPCRIIRTLSAGDSLLNHPELF